MVGSFAWAGLGFAIPGVTENLMAALLSASLSYCLAIYLYFVVIEQVSRNLRRPTVVASLIALSVGLPLVSSEMATHVTFEVARLFVAGAVAGWLLFRKRNLLTAYLVGFGCLALLSVVEYWPLWIEWIAGIDDFSDKMVTIMESNVALEGVSEEMRFQMLNNFRASVEIVARLAPALMVMSTVTQLSAGFLAFLYWTTPAGAATRTSLRFTSWKIPYQVAAVVIIASAVRLLSSGSIQIAADNLIFILAVYYSVAGLALTEWLLRRLKLALWFRIIFYLFMFLTGALGFAIVAILGFIDSFKDWRNTSVADLSLKNE